MNQKFALLSVTDKTNLDKFAKNLCELGYSILSTGGTAKFLASKGIPYISVSEHTGQKEILDGRVKTLHPKIHAGILSRRDNETDQKEMRECDFSYIDVIAVNLYPFREKRTEADSLGELSEDDLIEFIDIGGPTLLRASAKNYKYVYSVIDPADYDEVIANLALPANETLKFRKRLSAKVFVNTASYDLAIAEYLSREEEDSRSASESQYTGIVLEKIQNLRYGENPHQKASWYKPFGSKDKLSAFTQLQGKELSFNNINDLYAAVSLTLDLNRVFKDSPTCVVIKHANPCGIALGETLLDATTKAISCDPMSAFGGIISLSEEVNKETAELLTSSFYEVILAPSYSEDAKQVFLSKKNLRVLVADLNDLASGKNNFPEIRTLIDTALVQNQDTFLNQEESWKWVSGEGFTKEETEDAMLAWIAVKHVKSNAIVLAKDGMVIGIGAGQMNRFDSTELSILRAKRHEHNPAGSIAASDAFFPFGDTVESLHRGGIKAVLQPGGSIKDQEVIDTAQKLNVRMIFTGTRHFKH